MQEERTRVNDGYEAVHWAANYDDTAALNACIAADAACATRVTARGMTPLHICALNNSTQCARELLQLLPAAAIDAANSWGETALHLACACDAVAVRALLINAGADATARDAWGRTTFETAAASHAGKQRDAPEPPHPPPPPIDSSSFALQLKSAILSRNLRSVPAPVVRGIFSNTPPLPPPTPASPCARSGRRALSSCVEFPGDEEYVSRLLADGNVDAAGADCFGLTGVCVRSLL
jgi:hypothetical protein